MENVAPRAHLGSAWWSRLDHGAPVQIECMWRDVQRGPGGCLALLAGGSEMTKSICRGVWRACLLGPIYPVAGAQLHSKQLFTTPLPCPLTPFLLIPLFPPCPFPSLPLPSPQPLSFLNYPCPGCVVQSLTHTKRELYSWPVLCIFLISWYVFCVTVFGWENWRHSMVVRHRQCIFKNQHFFLDQHVWTRLSIHLINRAWHVSNSIPEVNTELFHLSHWIRFFFLIFWKFDFMSPCPHKTSAH